MEEERKRRSRRGLGESIERGIKSKEVEELLDNKSSDCSPVPATTEGCTISIYITGKSNLIEYNVAIHKIFIIEFFPKTSLKL